MQLLNLTATIFLFCFGSVTFGDDLNNRFFEEYESAHQGLEAALSSSSVTGDLQFPDGAGVEFQAFNKGKLFRTEFKYDERSQVLCHAATGYFACTKTDAVEGWALSISSDTESDMPGSFSESRKMLSPHFAVFGVPLRSLIGSDKFKLISSTEISVDGRRCLKLEFDAFPVLDIGNNSRTVVTVDPSNQWRIISSKFWAVDGREMSSSVAYEPDSNVPSTLVMKVGNELYRELNFDAWSFQELPDEPFTLEYYGLGTKEPSRSYWVYAVIVGVLLLGGGAVWKTRSHV